MTVDDVVTLVSKLGSLPSLALVVLVSFFLVWVFYKRWLVIGPFYSDLEARLTKTEEQRDDALELAAKLTGILEAGRRGSYRGR